MSGVSFTGVDPSKGIPIDALQSVDLDGANLTLADLTGANLSNVNMDGADLSSATLTDAILTGATYTERTLWPSGFDPQAAGAILE